MPIDDVAAGGEHRAGVVQRRVGAREVDDDVAAAEHVLERRAERRVGAARQLEVVGALDGGAHRLAHAARGARHGDADASCRDGLGGRAHRLDGGAERLLRRADAGGGEPLGRPQLVDELAQVVQL